jgi:hypothetical protein
MKIPRRIIERSRRYSVSEHYVFKVTLKHYDEHDRPQTMAAELLDLSPGGAKFCMPNSLACEDDLIVSLQSEELNLDLSLSARICWQRQQADGQWILGCAFDPQLPEAEIEHLFGFGLLERREAPRQSVRGQASARWESATEDTPVGLLDLSEGGFSMLSPMNSEPGQRLRLTLDSEEHGLVDAAATVRWGLPVDGGWIIGCEFEHRGAFSALEERFGGRRGNAASARPSGAVSLASIGVCMLLIYLCWQAWGG